MTVPKLARGACRWMPSVEHLVVTETEQARKTVKCCSCGEVVEHQFSYVTRAYGRNGVALPLPVFVHCGTCRATKDATEAWYRAYRSVPAPEPRRVETDEDGNIHIIDPND